MGDRLAERLEDRLGTGKRGFRATDEGRADAVLCALRATRQRRVHDFDGLARERLGEFLLCAWRDGGAVEQHGSIANALDHAVVAQHHGHEIGGVRDARHDNVGIARGIGRRVGTARAPSDQFVAL